MQIHRPKGWSHGDSLVETLSYDDVMEKVQTDIDNREDIMIPAKNIIFNMKTG